MTHDEFKSKLKLNNLNLTQFSELTCIPYSTASKFGKSNPVPPWVASWLNIYEENHQLNNIKIEIKELAEKLK